MNEQQQPRRNNTCLEAGQLIAWHDGALPPREADAIRAHLAVCARCTAEERALMRDCHQVFDLLSRVDPPPGANAEAAAALARFQERLTVQTPGSFLPYDDGHRHPGAFPPSGSERDDAMLIAVHPSPHRHRPRVLVPTLVAVLVVALLLSLNYRVLNAGSRVTPFLNGGSTPIPSAVLISVPNLIGQSYLNALAIARSYGFILHSVDGTDGKVVNQNPQFGEKAQAGTTIEVQMQVDKATIPPISKDMTLGAYVALLQSKGFVYSYTVSGDGLDPNLPQDAVSKVVPSPGTTVPVDTPITIYVKNFTGAKTAPRTSVK